MSILSTFKALFTRQNNTHHKTLLKNTPKTNFVPTSIAMPIQVQTKSTVPAFDAQAVQAELNSLINLPNNAHKDELLIAFATKSASTQHRWQAVQAASPAAWQAILTQVAPRDRRIFKWVKTEIVLQKLAQVKASTWTDLSSRYQALLLASSIEVRHFIDLDKAFDNAHAKHTFDINIQTTVAEWRLQLQNRLQAQNDTQRTAQRLLADIKHIYSLAQSGEYDTHLNVQLDTAVTTYQGLPVANGILAIQRLYEEINTLLPVVKKTLTEAAIAANQLIEVNQLVKKAQDFSQQDPIKINAIGIVELKRAWQDKFNGYELQKRNFEAALNQANQQLSVHQLQLTEYRNGYLNELSNKQIALAAALEAGQGQASVALFDEINTYTTQSSTLNVPALSSEQSAELDRLLSQAREIRGLLWEGAALEREIIINKLQSLADKPLVGKFQEAAFKEAMDAWKAINVKAGNAPSGVYNQFKMASDAAYTPIKLYKEGVRQVNTVGNEQRECLLAELSTIQAGIDWSTVNWRGVEDLRKEARKQWRECLPASYKHRDALYQRFDAVMQVFEEKLVHARTAELTRRENLTQAAKALDGQTFAEQHSQARELMARYSSERINVFMPRELDQASWLSFRAAVDAVYTRREAERQAEISNNTQAITDLINAKQTVLTQLKTVHSNIPVFNGTENDSFENSPLIHNPFLDAKSLQAALTKAQNDWYELGELPPNTAHITDTNVDFLVKDWLTTQADVVTSINSLKNHEKQARIVRALNLAKALDSINNIDVIDNITNIDTNIDANIDAIDNNIDINNSNHHISDLLNIWTVASEDSLIKQAFITRITALQNNSSIVSNTTETLHQALLIAEIANQIESPPAYKANRLALQVQSLSDKLTGTKQQNVDTGLIAWLTALALPNSTQGEAGERLALMMRQLS
jgi:hypothetical protein